MPRMGVLISTIIITSNNTTTIASDIKYKHKHKDDTFKQCLLRNINSKVSNLHSCDVEDTLMEIFWHFPLDSNGFSTEKDV